MEGDPMYSPHDIKLDEEYSHQQYTDYRNAVRT